MGASMGVDHHLLTQLLTLSGLLGGTVESCEIIKRRALRRHLEAERVAAERAGLRGLVRVLLTGSVAGIVVPLAGLQTALDVNELALREVFSRG